ncbi:two-component regulator propeller domain-containing protein [Fodinibius saliphilus]|uniref:two-component regulator propeller domain-containing protein n=1 Tax=Fodinibius saliphilus TaxID=1920650 RepID=UPI001485F169|nr:two-component regulator propeller domain-containing protein [Fodinibius saliphilus]
MNYANNMILYLRSAIIMLIVLGSALMLACQKDLDSEDIAIVEAPVITPPNVIKAGSFDTLYLRNQKPPESTVLSERSQPSETKVGFYATMQNYNTEHGLALSSLICSYKDKEGNIWFGTSGNGLSVYNGDTFTNYSSAHGLIHNFITSITQDSKGNFWFGTYGGISKYDGYSFENYTLEDGLPDNTIRYIHEDRNGTIWIASAGGVSIYNPRPVEAEDSRFSNYGEADGLISGSIMYILEDRKGTLWFAGTGGVSRYTGSSSGRVHFEDYSERMGVQGQIVNTIIEDDSGMIWLGSRELLSRYDAASETYTKYTTENGLENNYILISAKDSRGNLWFGTKGGVSKYRYESDTFQNFTTDHGLADNHVESITEDNSGSLWFGTYGGGISKYDGESLYEFSADQGLPGKAVYAITEDRKGNLWFAPLNGGIVEFRRSTSNPLSGTFVNYTEKHGLSNNTAYNAVEDKDGNLWFGTAMGLSMFDGEVFYKYTIEQGLPDNYITALFIDSAGTLWIGTYNNGVSKFDGHSFVNFSTAQGLVHKTVWNFFEDEEGIIWIATRGGLSRFDGTHFVNITTMQGLPDNKLSTITKDRKGNILTAGWGGGVSIIRKEYAALLSAENAGKIDTNIIEHFSTADGLANDVVYNIVEDRDGNLIIGSSYGFTILKGGVGDNPGIFAAEGVENYNEKTGYPIKDVSHIYSMHEDSRGGLWTGTGDKLVRFDYSKVIKPVKAPKLILQDIEINNQQVSWHTLAGEQKREKSLNRVFEISDAIVAEELLKFGRLLSSSERDSMGQYFRGVSFDSISSFYSIPQHLVLPYSRNNISFDFIGIETARPKMVRYRYKLKGEDESWSPVSEKRTASFGNIYEGAYTFMVQAKGPHGLWSEPLMYHFEILPPWYRSTVALLFYIFVFSGGVYTVHRFQKARTIRNEREKIRERELEQAKKIKKAYRKLEVEAALEKVRSTSVAMRRTSELQKVVNTVARQMQKINMNINGGVFIVVNKEVDRDVPIWGAGGATDYVKKAVVPFLDKPIFKILRSAIKERKEFLIEYYSKEEKDTFFEHLYKHEPWLSEPEAKKKEMLSLPGGYVRSLTVSSHTSIFIINNTGTSFSKEENDILRRFGRVFEQSYIRFMDLQIAEKQGREERRQASLDRVRGEIASMRSKEDLKQIIPVIWRELTVLNIPFFRCGILILDEENSSIVIYLSASDGRLLAVYNLSYRANPFTANVVEHWRKDKVYKEHWDRKDFIRWTKSMTQQGQIQNEKEYPGAKSIPESLFLHLIPFKQGMLYIGNHESLTPGEIDLSKSLAETFSIAYARYDDFNKLEHAKGNVETALMKLKAVQEQLVQQEKLASLGQLTAGIAHEIKNPLNFVTNFSDLSIEMVDEIQERLESEDSQVGKVLETDEKKEDGYVLPTRDLLNNIRKNLSIINQHGRRADGIIRSMLQQSGGNGKIQPTDLNNIIREFVNFAYHGMRSNEDAIYVSITMDLDESIGTIPLRSQDFSRVITNLCKNAFDAMKEKYVSEKSFGFRPELKVTSRHNDGQVIITFEDNGSGVDTKVINKIMQPFFTTKKGTKGTGLGLYITNDIVKAHGGNVEIESELNIYTRVIITLPGQHSEEI